MGYHAIYFTSLFPLFFIFPTILEQSFFDAYTLRKEQNSISLFFDRLPLNNLPRTKNTHITKVASFFHHPNFVLPFHLFLLIVLSLKLKVGSADLGLDDRSYYLDETYNKTMDAYLTFMTTAAVYLGAKESRARDEMKKVLDFETKIAQVLI